MTDKTPASVSRLPAARERMDSSELLRGLRGAVPVEDSNKVDERREALLHAIRQEISATPGRLEQRERRATWRRWGLVAAALLVAGLSTGAVVQQLQHQDQDQTAQGTTSDAHSDIAPGTAELVVLAQSGSRKQLIHAGERLALQPDEQAHLALPGGTQADLIAPVGEGDLRLARAEALEQEFYLQKGRLAVDVPERRDMRRRVVVHTPEARVQVKGTQFVVHVLNENQHEVTVVSVQRGSVWVNHRDGQTVLQAGETWRSSPVLGAAGATAPDAASGGDSREVAAFASSTSVATQATKPRVAKPGQTSSTTAATNLDAQGASAASTASTAKSPAATEDAARQASASSTLGEQNRLLEQAVSAQKSGDIARARQLLDELLRRYPDSPLRATVLAEKRRLDQ